MTAEIKRMTSGLSVAASHVEGLIAFAVSRGASLDELCKRAQISIDDLADRDSRLPIERYHALLAAGIALTGDPALAQHYGEALARGFARIRSGLDPPVAPDAASTTRARVE